MNNYFYVTLSVIILLAFLDILISKTKNGKLVKTIISIIAVTMLAVPVVSIVKGDNSFIQNGYYNDHVKEYLENLEKKTVINKINGALNKLEFDYVSVNVEFFDENQNIVLKKITVCISSAVINEDLAHIDILESVKNALSTVVDVEKVEISIEAN